jgi:large subunit ribosomal protein L13
MKENKSNLALDKNLKEIVIDASNKSFGRVASLVCYYLLQKDLPFYQPNKVFKRKVKVINLSKIRFTGKKLDQKLIRWHTGYVGHLKERKLKELWEKKPEEIFKKAVKGMLPKNRLLKKRIKLLELIK